MSITISLPPEAAREIERRAAAQGIDIAAFVLEAVEEKLADEPSAPLALSDDQWQREFQCWIASHHSRNPQLDDSRESIYD